MTEVNNAAMANQFFLSTLRAAGYSQADCEAISRGMTVTTFRRGEMPSDKKQRDKLIASWLESGRIH